MRSLNKEKENIIKSICYILNIEDNIVNDILEGSLKYEETIITKMLSKDFKIVISIKNLSILMMIHIKTLEKVYGVSKMINVEQLSWAENLNFKDSFKIQLFLLINSIYGKIIEENNSANFEFK